MPAQLVELPAQVEVVQQLARQGFELGPLLGRHRVQQRAHGRHLRGQLLEQLVQCSGVAGEEVAVAGHEVLKVRLVAACPLIEHLVEGSQHVLEPLQVLRRHGRHRLRHLVELAGQELAAQRLEQTVEALLGFVRQEGVLLQRSHLPGQVGRKQVELEAPVGVARALDGRSLLLDDLLQLPSDVVVDATQLVPVELLLAPLAYPVEELAQAGHGVRAAQAGHGVRATQAGHGVRATQAGHGVRAGPVAQARLEQSPEGGVQVAVVEDVVGYLGQDVLALQVEAGLGAVPAGVAEPRPHPQPRARYVARPRVTSLFSRRERWSPSSTSSTALATAAGVSPPASGRAASRRAGRRPRAST